MWILLVILKMDECDFAKPLQIRSLFDDRKYYMALKSKNLSYAKMYMIHQVEDCSIKVEEFNNSFDNKQPDVVIQRFGDRLKNFQFT